MRRFLGSRTEQPLCKCFRLQSVKNCFDAYYSNLTNARTNSNIHPISSSFSRLIVVQRISTGITTSVEFIYKNSFPKMVSECVPSLAETFFLSLSASLHLELSRRFNRERLSPRISQRHLLFVSKLTNFPPLFNCSTVLDHSFVLISEVSRSSKRAHLNYPSSSNSSDP